MSLGFLALSEDTQINNFTTKWHFEELLPSSVMLITGRCDAWPISDCSLELMLGIVLGCDRMGSNSVLAACFWHLG